MCKQSVLNLLMSILLIIDIYLFEYMTKAITLMFRNGCETQCLKLYIII